MDDLERARIRKLSGGTITPELQDYLEVGMKQRGCPSNLLAHIPVSSMLFGAVVGHMKCDLGMPESVIVKVMLSIQHIDSSEPYYLAVPLEQFLNGRPKTDALMDQWIAVNTCARHLRVAFNDLWDELLVADDECDDENPQHREDKRVIAVEAVLYLISVMYTVLPERQVCPHCGVDAEHVHTDVPEVPPPV